MQISLSIRQIQIPMRASFKHASAERKVTDSVWVEASRAGFVGLGEGCPRSYVTGETTEGAIAWIQSLQPRLATEITSLETLKNFVTQNRSSIDQNPAAWCAVEIALLDLLAREKETSVEKLLGIEEPSGRFQYTAVLSDERGEKFTTVLSTYLQMGFRDFKFKISESFENDAEKYVTFAQLLEQMNLVGKVRLRLDGNNVWAGRDQEALAYMRQVPLPLFAIEEPLAPRDADALSQLSVESFAAIVLDESLCRFEDIELYAGRPGSWIANLRVSKVGGILRSLEIVDGLVKNGIKIIVGAQVGETSVLSRAALTVAHYAGSALVAQEGAFGTLLLEKDVVNPVIMFGKGGVLELPPESLSPSLRGLGLEKTM